MKKTFAFFIFIFLLLWFMTNKKSPAPVSRTESTPLPTTTMINPVNIITVDFENNKYQIFYSKLSGREIRLVPNFSQKKLAQDLVTENTCQTSINGGYYTEEGKPLGLFIINGYTYSENVTGSSLLTGYFYLDETGKPAIDSNYQNQSSIIMQTGPLFLNNKKLATAVDEQARRSVLIEDLNGDIYALSIIIENEQFNGPMLSDLPPILFSIETPFKVVKGLNLDGGSASAYFSEDGFKLTELSTVGSIICAK